MTRWQIAREIVADLAPWFRSFVSRVAVYMMVGYLVGYAAGGPRLALSWAGLGGLFVSLSELHDLWTNRP